VVIRHRIITNRGRIVINPSRITTIPCRNDSTLTCVDSTLSFSHPIAYCLNLIGKGIDVRTIGFRLKACRNA
jgi:hypothetical protein